MFVRKKTFDQVVEDLKFAIKYRNSALESLAGKLLDTQVELDRLIFRLEKLPVLEKRLQELKDLCPKYEFLRSGNKYAVNDPDFEEDHYHYREMRKRLREFDLKDIAVDETAILAAYHKKYCGDNHE